MRHKSILSILAAGILFLMPSQAHGAQKPAQKNPECNEIRNIPFAYVVNTKGENETLKLDVYTPLVKPTTPSPAVVLFHGGGFRPGNDKTQSYIVTLCHELASRGFVCISPDYRIRLDKDIPMDEIIPMAVDDGIKAMEWTAAHADEYNIDLANVYVGGGSAGGMLTINMLSVYPERIKIHNIPNIRGYICLWGAMKEETLIGKVTADFPPTIFIHGTEDKSVPFTNSVEMDKRLKELNVASTLHPVKGAGHTPMVARKDIVKWILNHIAKTRTSQMAAITTASPRVVRTLDAGWMFRADDNPQANEGWERVNIPHTWNALDAADDTPGFRRGPGWYRRNLTFSSLPKGKRVVLHFEAVSSRAKVRVNGKDAGEHVGGYTAFAFDVTDLLHDGDNLIEVRADNTYDPVIPPLSADFTFFGGMYRDVQMILTDAVRISPLHYASSGVFITTPEVTDAQAMVNVRTLVDNTTANMAKVTLRHKVYDPAGNCVASAEQTLRLSAGEENQPVEMALKVANPHRWDIEDPFLYTVQSSIMDPSGKVLDEVTNPLGIRTFKFDVDKGFFLNDRFVKLVGTNRHQDYLGKGYALPEAQHLRDIDLLKNMGGNFLRISHYPQDPTLMAACDRAGLITSVEIPIVNAVTPGEPFAKVCEEMMKEMILQNFNSPSVCIWAYMNEVLLRPAYTRDTPAQEKSAYLKAVYDAAVRCNNVAKTLDPARVTMIPFHSGMTAYKEAGIDTLADLFGINLYQGWYGGSLSDFEKALDKLHTEYPTQPIIITEYGADADIRIRSANPRRFDYSIDYSMLFHEHYLPQMLARPFIVGSNVWNLNDFHSESRADAVPNFNVKGINTADRRHKDMYHYYRAMLRKDPVVHICGSDRTFRSGVETSDGICAEKVKVYTNADKVELFLDGKSLGTESVYNATALFEVPFHNGENRLEAKIVKDNTARTDLYVTDYLLVPDHPLESRIPFTEMNILLGSNRSFDDTDSRTPWIVDRPYTQGGWGYIGGETQNPRTNRGAQPASNLAINMTNLDPIYQTQRRGISAFRADLPAGVYEVELHFAELTTNDKKEALVYNLGAGAKAEDAVGRRFLVDINGVGDNQPIDVASEVGRCCPLVRRYRVTVLDQGLTVSFTPIESETMLSAIRILKVY